MHKIKKTLCIIKNLATILKTTVQLINNKELCCISDKFHWISIPKENLNSNTRSWLTDKKSLTNKLLKTYNANVKLKLLEYTKYSTENTTKALSNKKQEYMIRRVQLKINNIPKIYATTVFHKNLLKTEIYKHHLLNNKPLGKFLFENKNISRSDFEITSINSLQLPDDSGVNFDKKLWGRRSLFFHKQNSAFIILITEFFLDYRSLDM